MKALLLLAGLATFCASGEAQAPVPVPSPVTSEIAGVVEDPSGAVFPGVQVTAINQATNVRRSVTTDATGRFVVPSLPVGTYQVEVTASGFATLRMGNVRVEPGRSALLRLRFGGGPVPVPSPGGGSKNEGSSIVEWNVSDANSLEQRLTTKAEDGFELQAVVPTTSGKSLFVFDRAQGAAGAVEGHTGAARGRCKASLRTAGFPITGLLDVPQRRLGSSAEGVSFWVGG